MSDRVFIMHKPRYENGVTVELSFGRESCDIPQGSICDVAGPCHLPVHPVMHLHPYTSEPVVKWVVFIELSSPISGADGFHNNRTGNNPVEPAVILRRLSALRSHS